MNAAEVHEISNDWFVTSLGGQFWPTAPKPEDVFIEDIAHALSNACRFGGHGKFYSVAEHSVRASQIVSPENAFKTLMHDATEAYCGDMVRPLKKFIPQFKEIEEQIWLAICERFGMTPDMPDEVKWADDVMLLTEKRDVLPWHTHRWAQDEFISPLEEHIFTMHPEDAKRAFLDRFYELRPTARPIEPNE